MLTSNPLFFIGILPDESIQKEITAFKQDCARLFGAGHALKSPPHITLIPPFPWPLQQLKKLEMALEEFAQQQAAFELQLSGFDCFQPRVVFVDIVENQQLKTLQASLFHFLEKRLQLTDERARRFHPHITIAHRDLRREQFPKAWAHFTKMEYERRFQVEGLVLLEHVERKWLAREPFPFG
jgi:2'-5' RNA ligase